MADRDHISIGEVLILLQDDFPDITISKIRFLESQGLLDPERTPSGYRKFYDTDVTRLRWILTEQKEHFLPLKVIRDRLDSDPPDFDAPGTAETPEVPSTPPAESEAEDTTSGEVGGTDDAPGFFGSSTTGVSLTFAELAAATGLATAELRELERLGMLAGTEIGDQVIYSEQALEMAQLAAAFKAHGVEARHLRMYKVAAEREAGFYEQLLVPMLKQRNPDSRARARESLEQLAELGEKVRAAMLRLTLGDHFGPG